MTSDDELSYFGRFAARLVANGRNTGECGVLAFALAHKAVPVIDDNAARKIAREYGVEPKGALGLLIDAVRDGLLTLELVSIVADHLLESEYRLPFKPGGFERWAREYGGLGTVADR